MRKRQLRPVVFVLLVVLIGVNAGVLYRYGNDVKVQDSRERQMVEAAAYLIHKGDTFPGEFPTSSDYGPPNMPSVAVLTTMISRGQFPVPAYVAPDSLRTEQDILGVFASARRGFSAGLTFVAPAPTSCLDANVRRPVRVRLVVSGSLRLATHPRLLSTFRGDVRSRRASSRSFRSTRRIGG